MNYDWHDIVLFFVAILVVHFFFLGFRKSKKIGIKILLMVILAVLGVIYGGYYYFRVLGS